MSTDPDTGITYKRQRTGPLFAGYFNKIGLPGVAPYSDDTELRSNPWYKEQIKFDGDASQLYYPPDSFVTKEDGLLYVQAKNDAGDTIARRVGVIDTGIKNLPFSLTAPRSSDYVLKLAHDRPPAITRNKTGKYGGYFYTYYAAESQDGYTDDVTMDLGTNGQFRVTWNNAFNQVCGMGFETGTYDRQITYWADHRPQGNSYMGGYGWTLDPLVEYYIVETWHPDFRPPGPDASLLGTVDTDAGTYDIYQTERVNKPSIIGNATFPQFWSVRRSKRTQGTITFSNHFDAWDDNGLSLGSTFGYQVIISEGFNSTGQSLINMAENTPFAFADMGVEDSRVMEIGNNTGVVAHSRADFREDVLMRNARVLDTLRSALYTGEEIQVTTINGTTLNVTEANAEEFFATNQISTDGIINAPEFNAQRNQDGTQGVLNVDSNININDGNLNISGTTADDRGFINVNDGDVRITTGDLLANSGNVNTIKVNCHEVNVSKTGEDTLGNVNINAGNLNAQAGSVNTGTVNGNKINVNQNPDGTEGTINTDGAINAGGSVNANAGLNAQSYADFKTDVVKIGDPNGDNRHEGLAQIITDLQNQVSTLQSNTYTKSDVDSAVSTAKSEAIASAAWVPEGGRIILALFHADVGEQQTNDKLFHFPSYAGINPLSRDTYVQWISSDNDLPSSVSSTQVYLWLDNQKVNVSYKYPNKPGNAILHEALIFKIAYSDDGGRIQNAVFNQSIRDGFDTEIRFNDSNGFRTDPPDGFDLFIAYEVSKDRNRGAFY